MEEVKRSSSGQGLGVAGLVLGIVAIPLAVIPCTTVFGILLGILGITLSAIGLSQATRAQAPKGLILSGLVLSIIATIIAIIWIVFFTASHGILDNIKSRLRHESRIEMNRDVEEAARDLGAGKGMDKALQELEEATAGDSLSDKDFNKILSEYDDLTKQFLKEVEKSQKEGVSTVADVAQLSVKAAAVGAKLATAALRMTDEQRKRLEEIQKKYDEAFAKFKKK
jgi:DNA-directed RNA polymerase subunit L